MESASPPVPVQANNFQHQQDGIWPNGPVQLARGRQAKDPNAKTVTFNVSSLDDFETSLRQYLENPPENPEHTECQLSFWIGASFLVSAPAVASNPHAPQHQQQSHPHPHGQPPQPRPASHPQPPPGYQPANGIHNQYGPPSHTSHTYQSVSDPAIALTLPYHASASNGPNAPGASNGQPKDKHAKTSLSILEALAPTMEPKEKMRKQRAIAKCCIDAIQKVDGYRYSFHNCWNSREDDSFRFSYYCNDSLLNKDRAANGKGAKLGKRATKPVYDCKGVLSVKFSASKQSLDIYYKHVPVHKTYEERAPPPRKDSKRRKFLEENDPEALIRIANRPRPSKPPEELSVEPEAPPKPKKKKPKKEDEPKTAANSIESDLRAQSLRSLLELIQTDPDPPPKPRHTEPKAANLDTPNVGEEQAIQNPHPQPQPQPQQQQPRRRARNSCDVCKTKKTKCDGARPVCKTCMEKGRQCFYSDPGSEEYKQSMPSAAPPPQQHSEVVRQAQAANNELSELEKMKKELEEAKARIQQLEAEKTRSSSTPSQTPQAPQPRPHSQPQPPQQPPPQQQQMHTPQQMQTPQYGHFNNHPNHPSHPSYAVNRPIDYKNVPHAPPAQGTHQIHPANNDQIHASGTGTS
jgi:hypothetical protein